MSTAIRVPAIPARAAAQLRHLAHRHDPVRRTGCRDDRAAVVKRRPCRERRDPTHPGSADRGDHAIEESGSSSKRTWRSTPPVTGGRAVAVHEHAVVPLNSSFTATRNLLRNAAIADAARPLGGTASHALAPRA
jgi:hypothetical protein